MNHRCDMQLDSPSGVYRAGETVNGHIYLTLTERALIKAISLEANGFAATEWQQPQKAAKPKKSEQQNLQVEKQSLAFEQRVDYFAKIDYFVGSEAAQPQLMDAGTYSYGFHVKLPKSCPSSYEGVHGHIRYTLQLLMHSSAVQPIDVIHTRQLQVYAESELCKESRSGEVQCLEQTPRTKFWQRPLQLQLQIPRQAYSPGAGISVHVKLHNPQKLPLREVVYKLNMVSSYVGLQRNKPKRRDIKVERQSLLSSGHELASLPRSELEHFQHLHMLQVPQTPATLSSAACACLQINYEVEVLVRTQQEKRSIMAQVPITIGNVTPPCPNAIRSRDLLAASASAPEQTPTPGTATKLAPDFSASMTSLASNFREAEFMTATNLNKSNKHALSGEQLDFKPRYVYYEPDQNQTKKELAAH
ncbi:arrestin domain-containing protein 5 [Drosophila obscura]|uniref:arrestin domain-containing protein 5 n=1 Tax=Drosophila obscura TaxID=7282 RepID=UPI001BB274CD|nr:arrestin domain-containing protein 5 [Drosophila obscura]